MQDQGSKWWQAYLAAGGNATAEDFAIWLIRQEGRVPEAAAKTPELTGQMELPGMSQHAMAGVLIGRLQRFVHLSAKQALQSAGFANPEEFSLMATLFYMGSSPKTPLLRQCLMEITTGSQMLKRLRERGLVSENPNPADGRSDIIVLTPEGISLITSAFVALANTEDALTVLQPEERSQLLHLLNKLEKHHSHQHQVRQVGELMASGLGSLTGEQGDGWQTN